MTLMTAITAVPAVGLSSGALAFAPTNRAAWDAALATFRHAEKTSARIWAAEYAAEEAWGDACPRLGHYFDELNLLIGMKREAVVWELRHVCAGKAGFAGWLVCSSKPDAKYISKRDFDAIRAEADRLADEFMAYQERNLEMRRACRVDELCERAKACDRSSYFPAREVLMSLSAPDEAALLVKMEISARSLDDEHAESTLADAKRLLAVH